MPTIPLDHDTMEAVGKALLTHMAASRELGDVNSRIARIDEQRVELKAIQVRIERLAGRLPNV